MQKATDATGAQETGQAYTSEVTYERVVVLLQSPETDGAKGDANTRQERETDKRDGQCSDARLCVLVDYDG